MKPTPTTSPLIEGIIEELEKRFTSKVLVDGIELTYSRTIDIDTYKQFLLSSLQKVESEAFEKAEDELFPYVPSPMGVSQWREYGKKYKYWDYFKAEIEQSTIERCLRALPNLSPHNEWCNKLEIDSEADCDCCVEQYNMAIQQSLSAIKKEFKRE